MDEPIQRVCDKVKQSIIEGLEKAKALGHSILKKVFERKVLSAAEITGCKKGPDWGQLKNYWRGLKFKLT